MDKTMKYRESPKDLWSRGIIVECPTCSQEQTVHLWPDRTEAPLETVTCDCGRCGAHFVLEADWYYAPELDSLRLVGVS